VRVLLDTNVILDVWLAREPFWWDSAKLLAKIEQKKIDGVISPTTVTTLHYLAKKTLGENQARNLINSLLEILTLGEVSRETFKTAMESDIRDFEDAVIEAVAMMAAVDYIATRNVKDFKKSRIGAKEPAYITGP
jgi:predicted nucleic acid-binding protein